MAAAEGDHAAAGDIDVRDFLPGDQCGDLEVCERFCAGVPGADVQGGVSGSAGAGGAASAVRVPYAEAAASGVPDGGVRVEPDNCSDPERDRPGGEIAGCGVPSLAG